ncbi:hypothetical protein LTR86_003845 [Recurvomyces mirabilis]|nr:hypothetical protein LTR86_003845 [Recurvomyces mirabilis]
MLPNLVTRTVQAIFSVVVLGLSITAIMWQVYGSAPSTTTYGAFAGALGVLVALIGMAHSFINLIPDLIMAAVDALASVFLLAGGIALAVGLRHTSCSDDYSTATNTLINGGTRKGRGDTYYVGYPTDNAHEALQSRCQKIEADSVFLFLAFLVSVAAAVLCFMASKRGGRGVKRATMA